MKIRPCIGQNVSCQRGVALITGLIFLVVLTLLGITAARMSSLEERMSGNTRDRSLAMQAAEMTLRDAELDIRTSGRFASPEDFTPACQNGACYNGQNGASNGVDWNVTPVWSLVSMTAAPSAVYGDYTPATVINGLSAQPRYIVEYMPKQLSGDGSPRPYFRITVRAQGANPNTVVWLQELFKPNS
ncbi:pilus assembly protein [Thiobacillus sp.]|uniref:pilus assembly PilX family protein n=1 Tax=Thiobacillus sp. TaxID=924 RepID=UPI00286EAFDE|nr:pilus assembly protein [Thiobacillus sp.]